MQETYVKLHSPGFFYFILFISIALQAALGNGAVITVGPGESIQDAVDRARIGDILEIDSGYYEESVYVDKPLVIQGRNARGKTTIIQAKSSEGAVVLDADGCSLERLVIKNNEGYGIYVLSDNNRICNNSIDAQTGIYLEDCQGNNVANNIASGSQYLGTGIKLTQSSNNSLVKNTAFGGLLSSAIQLGECSNNNTIVDNFAGDDGIMGSGICLQDSFDNTIQSNMAITNSSLLGANGIYMGESINNTVIKNTAKGSGWKGNGIYVSRSDNNTITQNNILSDGMSESDGIFLANSNSNIIQGNDVKSNGDYGIDLLSSSNNNIIRNNIVKNNAKGIFIDGQNNRIYLNDFIDNGVNGYSWGPMNRWCTPEPKTYQYQDKTIKGYLGNRWSDYQGKDANGDGIGDRPYTFQDGNDAYPLMGIWEKYATKNI
jgi:nitrous oxidase accessory protein